MWIIIIHFDLTAWSLIVPQHFYHKIDAIKIVTNPSQYKRICVRKGKNTQLLVQFIEVFSKYAIFSVLPALFLYDHPPHQTHIPVQMKRTVSINKAELKANIFLSLISKDQSGQSPCCKHPLWYKWTDLPPPQSSGSLPHPPLVSAAVASPSLS